MSHLAEEPVKTPHVETHSLPSDTVKKRKAWYSNAFSRERFCGALAFNVLAFLLPALYGTLSKLWVAGIDSSMVATTDAYTYIGVITEVINDGLPRAAWLVIGNRERGMAERTRLANTLISFQALLGLILSILVLAIAPLFAQGFVPAQVAASSVTYVRISAFSALASTLEQAVANSTRALDKPDVALSISSVRFAVNIILDLIFISKVHVGGITPSVNAQAAIRVTCDLTASFAGLLYYLTVTTRHMKRHGHRDDDDGSEGDNEVYVSSGAPAHDRRPSVKALLTLTRPGVPTFVESLVRNALYLWVIHTIVALGLTYTTAWSVFTAIRWGLVMVPVQALEATSLALISHRWGAWRSRAEGRGTYRASWREIREITMPAQLAFAVALAAEAVFCGTLSRWGARPFALYLSDSANVADVAAHMWRTIDWCYIFYATSTQMAAVLLATAPRRYLAQSLAQNALWVLPWAVVCQTTRLDPDNAWFYHAMNFGGSLVFGWAVVAAALALWARALRQGRGVKVD